MVMTVLCRDGRDAVDRRNHLKCTLSSARKMHSNSIRTNKLVHAVTFFAVTVPTIADIEVENNMISMFANAQLVRTRDPSQLTA